MERETFVFYQSWKRAIEHLPADIRLEIYESVIEYAFSGTISGELKPMAMVAFNFIKNDIERDTSKYMEKVARNRENGAKGAEYGHLGGRPPKPPKTPVGVSETPKNPLYEYEDDCVYEDEDVNDEGKNKQKAAEPPPFSPPAQKILVKKIEERVMTEFARLYTAARQTEYAVTRPASEKKAAIFLVKKLREKKPQLTENEVFESLSQYFSVALRINNRWYYDNITLSLIHSKFNEINQILKNEQTSTTGGAAAKGSPRTTDRDAAEIICKHFANDYEYGRTL